MVPTPDGLDEQTVARDPFDQFRSWYADATVATDDKAGAMTVATATRDGRPSARVVLLRGFDERGLVFYTSYDSRKGAELDENPYAAAVLYWPDLDRQIRVEGTIARVDQAESEAYFAARPRGHRLSAWASAQSTPVPDRRTLEAQLAEVESRFPDGDDVPLPPFWGGYRLTPDVFEFWVSRSDRLHDRVRYRRGQAGDAEGWVIERLSP
jgi:pyridoxamine 5'-phosphate oxidase